MELEPAMKGQSEQSLPGQNSWMRLSQWWKHGRYVFLYLIAIVLANLTTSLFGPGWSVVNAFLFIGLDLTARDKLHDAWHGKRLVIKMGALIAVGSILSYALNRNAGQIAIASFIAFAAAAITDTIVYSFLRRRSYMQRVNGSNLVSAAVDSVIFPAIAFGLPLRFDIMLLQYVAKIVGGYAWALVLRRKQL
jgi:queuosine precursor transporter